MMSSRTLHDQAGGAYEQCTMVFDGGQAYRLFLTYNVCRAQDYFLNAANWQWLSASAFFNSYFRCGCGMEVHSERHQCQRGIRGQGGGISAYFNSRFRCAGWGCIGQDSSIRGFKRRSVGMGRAGTPAPSPTHNSGRTFWQVVCTGQCTKA